MVQPRAFEDDIAKFLESGEGFRLEVARGVVKGLDAHHHTGANPSIAASSTEVVSFEGGTVVFLTVADEVRVKAGNAADTIAGDGARTVHVEGLDEKFEYAHATLVTAGESAGAQSGQKFIRIWHANVEEVGVYGAANTADVVIETAAGTALVTLEAGKGSSQSSVFTIPAHHTAYLTRISVEVDANKPLDIFMYERKDAHMTAANFKAKRLMAEFRQLEFSDNIHFESYLEFTERTDIWFEAVNGSGATAAVVVDYDLLILNSTEISGREG